MRFRAAIIAALVFAGAGGASAVQTDAPRPKVETGAKSVTVAGGLVHPWSLAFLPDGRMLVTERPGRLRIVTQDGRLSRPVSGVPEVADVGQGGLLDVVLAPDFRSSSRIYFSFSEERDGGNGTSVAHARLVETDGGPRLENVTVIFRQMPAVASRLHFGSRLAFAPDGTLFVTLGERGQMKRAQDLDRHWGKVVRINADGSVPKDNPFVGRDGVRPEIWSTGHRNPQAAAIHPVTGRLWTVEHGARGGDEINRPEAGKNYGWPVITYGIDYSGARIGEGTAKPGLEQPVYYWDPSIAPSGMAFYTGEAFPEWRGNLFVGALAQRHLSRLLLDGDTVIAEQRLLEDLGQRIRDVRQGTDGALYVITDSSAGQILRVTPK